MKTTVETMEQPNQKGLKFYVDKRQAKIVFDLLIQRLSEKGPPYNMAHVPQADKFLPVNLEKGTASHAIFLFMLCFWMRGGVESDTAADFLKNMYEKNPNLFEPSIYRDKGSEATKDQIIMITAALKEHRLGQRVDENAPAWVYNMRKLDRFWKGDPRNLMIDGPAFNVMAKRIIGKTFDRENSFANQDSQNGFRFFREKMTAMIAYFLIDAHLVPIFYTPVPVDFHVLRLLTSNGILRVRGKSIRESVGINFMKESTLRLCRQVTEWYCREYEISPIALCDSLWLLSRTLCRNNPGNSSYVIDLKRQLSSKKEKEEELFLDEVIISDKVNETVALGISGRKRYRGLRWSAIEMSHPVRMKRLKDSCGKCPVENQCNYNIPSGAYYVGGKLLPERLRVSPPKNGQIDFLGGPGFEGVRDESIDPDVRFTRISLKA